MSPSLLESEIYQQPDILEALLGRQQAAVQKASSAIHAYQPQYLMLAARGSSDNAARYGQYLFGAHNQLPVALATPSLFTQYKQPPLLGRAVVVAISQSGKSEDILAVLTEAKRQGVLTLAITNDDQSPMAETCDYLIHLGAGEERSVAASKTYTASLMALAMLSCALSGDAENQRMLSNLPEIVAACIQEADAIYQIAALFRDAQSMLVIGRGFNYATAFEIALKIKELAYVIAAPYSTADFLHGPVALVKHGMHMVTIGAEGKLITETQEFMARMKERAAKIIVISNQASLFEHAQVALPLVPATPEWLSPISLVVPGQLFALGLTIAKGLDPDSPRGLKKVTITH